MSLNVHDLYTTEDTRRNESYLIEAGFEIVANYEDDHGTIDASRNGILIRYIARKKIWKCFGQTWQGHPQQIAKAIDDGVIRLPDDARGGLCGGCGEGVWWVQDRKGKWFPTDNNGIEHIGCPFPPDC